MNRRIRRNVGPVPMQPARPTEVEVSKKPAKAPKKEEVGKGIGRKVKVHKTVYQKLKAGEGKSWGKLLYGLMNIATLGLVHVVSKIQEAHDKPTSKEMVKQGKVKAATPSRSEEVSRADFIGKMDADVMDLVDAIHRLFKEPSLDALYRKSQKVIRLLGGDASLVMERVKREAAMSRRIGVSRDEVQQIARGRLYKEINNLILKSVIDSDTYEKYTKAYQTLEEVGDYELLNEELRACVEQLKEVKAAKGVSVEDALSENHGLLGRLHTVNGQITALSKKILSEKVITSRRIEERKKTCQTAQAKIEQLQSQIQEQEKIVFRKQLKIEGLKEGKALKKLRKAIDSIDLEIMEAEESMDREVMADKRNKEAFRSLGKGASEHEINALVKLLNGHDAKVRKYSDSRDALVKKKARVQKKLNAILDKIGGKEEKITEAKERQMEIAAKIEAQYEAILAVYAKDELKFTQKARELIK